MSNNCILSCAPIMGSVAVVYSPRYNVEMAQKKMQLHAIEVLAFTKQCH